MKVPLDPVLRHMDAQLIVDDDRPLSVLVVLLRKRNGDAICAEDLVDMIVDRLKKEQPS